MDGNGLEDVKSREGGGKERPWRNVRDSDIYNTRKGLMLEYQSGTSWEIDLI